MRYAIAVVAVLLTACSTENKDGSRCRNEDWTCRKRYEWTRGEVRDGCVNEKLNRMSDSDHVQKWDADLMRALLEICTKMYPDGK